MKDDERRFLYAIYDEGHPREPYTTPRELAERLDIPEKRAEYLYAKWERNGWYDCGVSARTGWLTDEGREAVREMRG